MGKEREGDLPKGISRHRNKFRARVRIDGKWGYRTLEATTVEEVWKEHNRQFTTYEQTVAYGVERYIEHLDGKKRNGAPLYAPATIRTNRIRAKAVAKVWGEMRFDEIQTGDLYLWGDKENAWRLIKQFSAMWSKWRRWQMFNLPNPFENFEYDSDVIKGKRTRYLTNEEVQIICDTCYMLSKRKGRYRFTSAIRSWAVLVMIYLTGRRVSNVLSLKLSNLKDDGIHFYETKTKNHSIVQWSPALKEVVNMIKIECAPTNKLSAVWLIPNTWGGEYKPHTFNSNFQDLMPHFNAAGVPYFQPRDLRAKYGTDHANGQKNLLHTNSATFRDHYDRLPQVVTPIK